MGAIDERTAKLRDQMNRATSNKEYSALLTEVNTLKADKSKIETAALERMTKLDEIRSEIEALRADRDERIKMRAVAESQRDERAAEVKQRLEELQKERAEAASGVPTEALQIFETRSEIDPEEIMAPVEEHSRRNFEYACGACQVMLPMETVSTLLGSGELTKCVSCGVILYLDESLREAMSAKK
jgi:predicted  nucleic acid-binding Zn-ribbon protein